MAPLPTCDSHRLKSRVEIWGIEPQTFHMQSERSTTELYPLPNAVAKFAPLVYGMAFSISCIVRKK